MKTLQKYTKLFYLMALSLVMVHIISCQDFYDWAKEWQKKQIERRYGSAWVNKDKLEDWEKDIIKYEKELDNHIKTTDKLANIYRKLGETYKNLGNFQLCVKNLKQAITYGHTEAEVFYQLGICQGNLARTHNWEYNYTKEAEQTFLKVLNLKEGMYLALYQLSLIYFHGYSKNNIYSILGNQISIPQRAFRRKAIQLMKEFQFKQPTDKRSYFALSGMYQSLGHTSQSISQLKDLIQLIKKNQPDTYTEEKDYEKALLNLNILKKNISNERK